MKKIVNRIDGRRPNEIRPVELIPAYVLYPEGSVLISLGNTKVLCNATIQESLPGWMKTQEDSGGWVTAEYALLPRSTHLRKPRENRGPGGRSQEIRRFIGRSLRTALDLSKLGQRTCILDCDVIQADGGTRTAAVTGGYVALVIAIKELIVSGKVPPDVLKPAVAAISVGVVDGQPLLDLCYQEDAAAEVDVNVVMNAAGEFIEVQGTAEKHPFSRMVLNDILDLAQKGISELLAIQEELLGEI